MNRIGRTVSKVHVTDKAEPPQRKEEVRATASIGCNGWKEELEMFLYI